MSYIKLNPGTTIDAIMSDYVVTISPDDALSVVSRLFNEHRFHHLVVMDRGKAVGVISERDLLKHISPFVGTMSEKNRDLWTLDKKVHQVMSRTLVWGAPGMKITDAALLMAANRISCLPVLDDRGRPIGIVTTVDVLRWIADHLSHDADEAQDAA